MKQEKLPRDHVISIFHSRTCPVDYNEKRETAGDHVIRVGRVQWTKMKREKLPGTM